MARTVRVIACLDVKDGQVVKGVKFQHLKDVGTPLTLAQYYSKHGADDVVVLDVAASREERPTDHRVVREVVENSTAPVSAGGGVKSVDDIQALLEMGARTVFIGTAAYTDPGLVAGAVERFGSDVVGVSVDARRIVPGTEAFTEAESDGEADLKFELMGAGGTEGLGVDAVEFAKEMAKEGAGTILLNSVDEDGTQGGFDLELVTAVAGAVDVPVIASGGAGKRADFVAAAQAGASGVLGASVFHSGKISIEGVKNALSMAGFTTL